MFSSSVNWYEDMNEDEARWRAARVRLTGFGHEGIFIVPYLLWHGTFQLDFVISSNDRALFSSVIHL